MSEFITSVSNWLTSQHAVELSGWVWVLLSILGIVGVIFGIIILFAFSVLGDIGNAFVKAITNR